MDLFDAIANRHSYRGPFTDDPVPGVDLKRIVQAGLLAPSGKNAQTTTFVVVDERELVEQINAMHPMNKAIQTAKAFIICLVDREPEAIYAGYDFQVEDCAAAVENMLLAITALGYASVWIDGWLRGEGRTDRLAELLGIPGEKIARVMLPVGVPAKEVHSQVEKKPLEARARFNQYEARFASPIRCRPGAYSFAPSSPGSK